MAVGHSVCLPSVKWGVNWEGIGVSSLLLLLLLSSATLVPLFFSQKRHPDFCSFGYNYNRRSLSFWVRSGFALGSLWVRSGSTPKSGGKEYSKWNQIDFNITYQLSICRINLFSSELHKLRLFYAVAASADTAFARSRERNLGRSLCAVFESARMLLKAACERRGVHFSATLSEPSIGRFLHLRSGFALTPLLRVEAKSIQNGMKETSESKINLSDESIFFRIFAKIFAYGFT